jgi:RNA polymerase sigma factor (sigma-70 family)
MIDSLAALLRYPLFAALDRADVADWVSPAETRRYATGVAEADSLQLSGLVDRLRAGEEAREELIRVALGRLERLTRKMLRGFPAVRRWEETGDVLQNTLIRLDRALRAIVPESSRAFFGLAAEQIRRELLDLVRHYSGPLGLGRNCRGGIAGQAGEHTVGADPADARDDPDDLERWAAFHAAVERLPVNEREVVGLVFYQGWTQAQVAELFCVSERTVRRWWERALQALGRCVTE